MISFRRVTFGTRSTYRGQRTQKIIPRRYVVGMTSIIPAVVEQPYFRRTARHRRFHEKSLNVGIALADSYMAERTARFEWRVERYRAALEAMSELGLNHKQTVLDVGAGWTELDAILRTDGQWRGRYIPADFGVDGTDLEYWKPPRPVDFAVALEIIKHLHDLWRLVFDLKRAASAVIISVPNPETTDVLGMDDDHKTVIHRAEIKDRGFVVSDCTFYGGFYSAGRPDAVLAIWCGTPNSVTHTAPTIPMYRRRMMPADPTLTPQRGDHDSEQRENKSREPRTLDLGGARLPLDLVTAHTRCDQDCARGHPYQRVGVAQPRSPNARFRGLL